MNCSCLDEVLKQNESRHSFDKKRCGEHLIQTPINSKLLFGCTVVYTQTLNRLESPHTKTIHRDKMFHDIPMFFCPLCGKKTNQQDFYGYYEKFLNKNK